MIAQEPLLWIAKRCYVMQNECVQDTSRRLTFFAFVTQVWSAYCRAVICKIMAQGAYLVYVICKTEPRAIKGYLCEGSREDPDVTSLRVPVSL